MARQENPFDMQIKLLMIGDSGACLCGRGRLLDGCARLLICPCVCMRAACPTAAGNLTDWLADLTY